MAHANEEGHLGRTVAAMLESYSREPRTYRVGGPTPPSKDGAVKILHLCFEVLFPGYYGRMNLSAQNVR